MSFVPKVKLTKSGDRLAVWVRQKYYPRGIKGFAAWRWELAGVFSLRELTGEEKNEMSKR